MVTSRHWSPTILCTPVIHLSQRNNTTTNRKTIEDVERQRAELAVRALLLQAAAAEATRLNNLHTLGSYSSTHPSSEEEGLAFNGIAKWVGWIKKKTKKKNKAWVGLEGQRLQ